MDNSFEKTTVIDVMEEEEQFAFDETFDGFADEDNWDSSESLYDEVDPDAYFDCGMDAYLYAAGYDADYLEYMPDDEKYQMAYEDGYRGRL